MLSQNDLLLYITDELAYREPNWGKVFERYSVIDEKERARIDKDPSGVNLSSILAEIHLRISLEDICLVLESNVRFDPIGDGDTTPNYKFRYRRNGILVDRHGSGSVTELDELVLIEDLPVVFEIKLAAYQGGIGSRKRRGEGATNKVGKTFNPEYYLKKLNPVMEYFSTSESGFVLVIDPTQINPNSHVQQEFISQGGIIVPFYKPRHEYRDQVRELGKSITL